MDYCHLLRRIFHRRFEKRINFTRISEREHFLTALYSPYKKKIKIWSFPFFQLQNKAVTSNNLILTLKNWQGYRYVHAIPTRLSQRDILPKTVFVTILRCVCIRLRKEVSLVCVRVSDFVWFPKQVMHGLYLLCIVYIWSYELIS